MRFSVVIPTLNEASTIETSLRRLEPLSPLEVIVSDGGSDDGTPEIARRLATVVSGPTGRGVQLNTGAAHATGDVIVFLHADVRLPDDAFTAIEAQLRAPDVAGGFFRVRFGSSPHEAFVAAAYELLRHAGIVYGDATIFARRAAFEAIGGFRADFPIMEDVNFVSRLRGLGRVVALQQIVVPSSRRWQRSRWRAWASWWAIQLLFGVRVPPRFLARMYEHVR